METQTETQPSKAIEGKGSKFLAGVGIVALLFAAVWLGIQAVQFGSSITSGIAGAMSGIGSLFGRSENIVLVADPAIVATENSFVLSWEHENKGEEGSYTFIYECAPSINLNSSLSTNNANVVFCNTPFNFVNDGNKLLLGVVSTNESPTEIELEIHFTPNDSDVATEVGKNTITVVDDPARIAEIAGIATSTETGTDADEGGKEEEPENIIVPTIPATQPSVPGPTTVVTGILNPVNDPNGTPDLTLNILAVGKLDGKIFTAQTGKLNPDDRLAVKFEVINRGTKDSGPWNFEGSLPTERRYTFESDDQETLLPGARIEYILGFDDVEDDDATATIRIEIDPNDDVDESNENNNVDTVTIEIDN